MVVLIRANCFNDVKFWIIKFSEKENTPWYFSFAAGNLAGRAQDGIIT